MKNQPGYPKKLLRLLERWCPEDLYEAIAGDLIEQYEENLREMNPRKAGWYFILATLKFFRPGILFRNNHNYFLMNTMTFLPNLILFYRKFKRNKVYGSINIFGLSVSLALIVLIYLFVQHEFSYNQFHVNKDHIYLANNIINIGPNKGLRSSIVSYPLADALKAEHPGVVNTCRLKTGRITGIIKEYEQDESVTFVDNSFFSLFSFEIIAGDNVSPLSRPDHIVLSESMAFKYYGDEDPIGQVFHTKNKDYIVTAVIEDTPYNSSINTNILVNIESIFPDPTDWESSSIITFIQTTEDISKQELEEGINHIVEKHTGPLKDIAKEYFPDYDGSPIFLMSCVPFNDVYFDENTSLIKRSKKEYSYIMISLALLILAIACINYILLTLAGSDSSVKEVGIKKVIGVSKYVLGRQLMGESVFMALFSGIMGIFMAWYFLPEFNTLSAQNLQYHIFTDWKITGSILLIVIFTGLLAGAYPSLFLAGLSPLMLFKQHVKYSSKGRFTRGLIVIQFTICLFFIGCTWVMHRQMEFVRSTDLGMDTDQIIKIDIPDKYQNKALILERIKQEIGNKYELAGIRDLLWYHGVIASTPDSKSLQTSWFQVDHQWADVLGVDLIAGRNFDPGIHSDSLYAVVINETLAKALGHDNPVGKKLTIQNRDSLTIIGIVKDFHNQPLTKTIEPTYFAMSSLELNNILVRVPPQGERNMVADLENAWKKAGMDTPLDFVYLDEVYNERYGTEYRWQRIMDFASFFGMAIACLGLFGLVGLEAHRRTREIAIRKVFGAGALSIFWLLNHRVVKILAYSMLISTPLIIWAMQEWLKDFAYKMDFNWHLIPLSGCAALLVAVFAVLFPVIRAVRTDPVISLKGE
ncbi:MAG: ABC transporter permease [Cyclobacteriaceae bacterium]|nr:ABC transporter permease [Cyclobacteriaceae bacterium]